MPLPSDPTVGQQATLGLRTFEWTGARWASVLAGGGAPVLASGLPTGVEVTDDYANTTGTVINDCTTNTGWANFLLSGEQIGATVVEEKLGHTSVRMGIQAGGDYDWTPAPYWRLNLASDVNVDTFTRLILEVCWEPDNGFTTSGGVLTPYFSIHVASAANLGGTVVTTPFPPVAQGSFNNVAVDLTGLTTIRSLAIKKDLGTFVGVAGASVTFWIREIRFANETPLDRALDAAEDVAVIVSPTYTPSVAQDPRDPAAAVSSKTVVDLREDRAYISRLNSVRHLHEWDVPLDGTTDVTGPLAKVMNELGDYETLLFPADGVFRIEGPVPIRDKRGVTIDCNGSHFYWTTFRGGNNNVSDNTFPLTNCVDVTMRRANLHGWRTKDYNGSALHDDTSTPTTVSTTKTLDAHHEAVRTQNVPTQSFYMRHLLEQFNPTPSVKALVLDHDPDFRRGVVVTANLSDTNQVAGDCVIELVQTDGLGPSITLDADIDDLDGPTAVITVDSTASFKSWHTPYFLIDGELFKMFAVENSTELTVERIGVRATHTAGAPLVFVLAARALTLTSTPTDYALTFDQRFQKDIHQNFKVRVRKATAATNTITVHSAREYGYIGYSLSNDSASSIVVGGNSRNVTFEDIEVEGSTTDAFDCSNSLVNGVTIRNCVSRGSCRQGMSFNQGRNFLIEDFMIGECGRSGIDIEPFQAPWVAENIRIRNGIIYNATNYTFACNNWSQIFGLHIENVEAYGAGIGFLIGGGHDSSITNCYADTYIHTGGLLSARQTLVNGRNMRVSDCTIAGDLIVGETSGSWEGVEYAPSHNLIENVLLTDGGTFKLGAAGQDNTVRNVRTDARLYGGDTPSIAALFGTDLSPRGGRYSDIQHENVNQFPDTFKGPLATDIPFVRGGHNHWDEPVIGVRALSSGLWTETTVLATTALSGTGTTGTIDLGARGRHGQLKVSVNDQWADQSSSQRLNVTVQVSQNGSVWYDLCTLPPIGRIWQLEYGRFRYLERYMRLSYQLTGSTSVQTTATLRHFGPGGMNLGQSGITVTETATSKAVTFPGGRHATLFPHWESGVSGTNATGGTLNPSTTYYYRLGGRTRDHGPAIWLDEKTTTTGAGDNAVNVGVGRWLYGASRGFWMDGFTILRGTTTGVYTVRYDVLPKADHDSFAGYHPGGSWTDLGDRVNAATQWTGHPVTFPTPSGPYAAVDESGWEPNTSYGVIVTPSWLTTYSVTSKARSGFTVNFGTAAPAGATFDYMIIR